MKTSKLYRLLLFLIVIGFAGIAHAQTPVTGHVIGANNTATTNGAYVQFRLQNFAGNVPRLNGTGVCAAGAVLPFVVRANPGVGGLISLTLCGNDVITPQTCGATDNLPCTFYTVEYYANGTLQYSYNFSITGSGTFNIDTATPLSAVVPPAPPTPGPQGPPGPPAGAWSSTITYPAGAVVSYMNALYVSNAGGNLNNLPTNPTYWTVSSGGGGGSPGGSNTQLQFNSGGLFGGASGITTPDGNVLNAEDVFTSGFSQIDVQCTGVAATDSAAIRAAILTQKNTASNFGHVIVLDGVHAGVKTDCAWDGTIVGDAFDGGVTNAVFIIGIKGAIDTYNEGITLGLNDLTTRVHLIAIRASGAGTFGRGSALVDSGDSGNYPLLDIPGIEGDFLSDGITYEGVSTTAPTVRVHTFDKYSTNCNSVPCGSTQLVFKNGNISNTGGATALDFDDNGLVNRGAWSSMTTYAFDDEASYMGHNYISAVSGNLNHVPTGGSPNWSNAITISGFDASIEGMSLNSSTPSVPPLYAQDFGNLHIDGGVETWITTNGGPAISLVCSAGATCTNYMFHLVGTESVTGDVITATGALGLISMDNIYPSDGSAYLIKSNTAGVVNISSHYNGPVKAILDPASATTGVDPTGDQDSTTVNSLVSGLPTGFYNGRVYGQQQNNIRSGTPVNVQYPNISAYGPTYTVAFGSATQTTGQTDYLGGTTATKMVTTVAPMAITLYTANLTPAAGDVYGALVPIHTDTAGSGSGETVSVNLGYSGGSIPSTLGRTQCSPYPSGYLNDTGWQMCRVELIVTAADGMTHALNLSIGTTDTNSPFYIAPPILINPPNGTPITDVIAYMDALTPYPPSATVGQVWNANGEACFTGTPCNPSSLTVSGISGLTQCVHANSAGLFSGTGSDCGSGGGGGGITLETNGSDNSSQTALNLLNSAAFNGLTATFTNTSGGNVQAGFSGTLGNAGLTNPATTVNGQTCTLGSTCAVPFNTAGSGNTSQAGINFLASIANASGLAITPSNPATNGERFEITGTCNAASGCTGQNSSTSNGVAQLSAGVWSFSTALANGTTATTQATNDNTTKVATGAAVQATTSLANLATVGTIATGAWHGTAIANTYGGTGQNSSSATGVAQLSSGTWSFSAALANGTNATTQTVGDSSTDVATDAFVLANGFVNPGTTLGDFFYCSNTSTPCTIARLPGATAPNGVPSYLISVPSGGVATAPITALAGVPVNNNSETTCATQTLNVLDRATAIFCSGASTSTFTLPVHSTSGFGANFPMNICNYNSGVMTLTPTTDTIDNGTLQSGWCSFNYNDGSGNWHTTQMPTWNLFSGLATGLVYNTTSTGKLGIATGAQVNTVIQGLTGCNTANFVYTPQGADCVAVSTGSGTQYGVTYWATSTTLGTTAAGGANFPLLGVSSAAPAFSAIAYPTSLTSGGILYGSSTTALSSSALLTAHGVVLGEGAGSAPVATSAGTAGQCLTSNGSSSDPTYQICGVGAGVSSLSGDGNIITNSLSTGAVTLTIAGTSGGIPYFSGTSAWASSGLLTHYGVVFGGGAAGAPTSSAQGASNAPLIGQGASNPIFSSILYLTSLTSGGAVCGTSTTQLASSALLATNALVVGGGSGACPATGNGDFTYATHTLTGGSSAILDMSAASVIAPTQTAGDNSTKVATTAYTNRAYDEVESSGCTTGAHCVLVGKSGYYECDSSAECYWTLDAPVAGKQYCFQNFDTQTNVLSITTTTSVYITYKGLHGTVTTGTLVSGGGAGDFICMKGEDATHYFVTGAGYGTWTNN